MASSIAICSSETTGPFGRVEKNPFFACIFFSASICDSTRRRVVFVMKTSWLLDTASMASRSDLASLMASSIRKRSADSARSFATFTF